MENVPSFYKLMDWTLLYSLNIDGCSIGTFLEKAKKCKNTVMVVQENKGNTFGGFCNEEWMLSTKFYGTGENFLYTFRDKANVPEIYRWTGEND